MSTPEPRPGSIGVTVGGERHDTGTFLAGWPEGAPLTPDALCLIAVSVVEWAVDQGADRDNIRAMS